jgi:excisionase family DNA binding protein
MLGSLEIDNKKMQSVSTAADSVGYSRDYVTKLARDQKIAAVQIGRQWFVEPESLQEYAKQRLVEQKVRQQELSEIRKAEREVALQKAEAEKIPTPFLVRVTQQKSSVALLLLLGLASTYSVIHFSPFTHTGFGSAQVVSSTAIPEFQMVESSYEVAIGTTVSAQEPVPLAIDFSQESVRLSDIENFENGILLLPYGTATKDVKPEALFSDTVKILTDEFGQEYVVRVDDQDQVITEIPFVVVPVAHNQQTP